VWCAVIVRWIISTMFYHETMNLDQCVRNILNPFLNSWLMMKDSVAAFI
jgi:hypothetical protein